MKNILTLMFLFALCHAGQAQSIIKAEYFIDTDPGYAQATSVPLTNSSDSLWAFDINIPPGLTLGNHKLYLRTLDDHGAWSQTIRRNIEVYNNDNPEIIGVDYFFTTDAGFGSSYSSSLTPAAHNTWLLNIPLAQLPTGIGDTVIYVRVLESINSSWSLTIKTKLRAIATQIEEEPSNPIASITPNPSNGKIRIEFTHTPDEPIYITISSILGEKLMTRIVQARSNEIDIDYPKGVYFILLQTTKGSTIKNILLN